MKSEDPWPCAMTLPPQGAKSGRPRARPWPHIKRVGSPPVGGPRAERTLRGFPFKNSEFYLFGWATTRTLGVSPISFMRIGVPSSKKPAANASEAALSARSSEAWTPTSLRPHTTANWPAYRSSKARLQVSKKWVSACAESMAPAWGQAWLPSKKRYFVVSHRPAVSRVARGHRLVD